MYPVKRSLRVAVVLAAVACAGYPAAAIEWIQQAPQSNRSDPEFTQSAADLNKGQLFMTKGLVCDRVSEIDAVITLAKKGEKLDSAVEQVNAGAEAPRCIVGRALIAEYGQKAQSFSVEDQTFEVHQVRVVGVAMQTPHGMVPMRLQKPLDQFVVSTDNAEPA